MNITFISRPYFFREDTIANKKCIVRLSARVRGEEVAQYLGGKYNSEKIDEGVRIFIKPRNLKKARDEDYLDIIDGVELLPQIKLRPKIKVIAMSQVHYDYLKLNLENEVILIPHHHINFENQIRKRGDKLVGGIICNPAGGSYALYEKTKEALAKIGVDLTYSFHAQTRKEMVDYYMSIDFLVNWYPKHLDINCFYRHPAKLINAASFSIPTLAQPILGYQEMEGFYLPIENLDSLVEQVEKLKDINFYNNFSKRICKEAKKYHISKTTKLYIQLCQKM